METVVDGAYKPKMRVKLRLTTAWQNKLLLLLSSYFNVHESWPEDHVIYVPEIMFVKFLFAAQKNEITACTLKQLNAEYVDMRKEPQITVVRLSGNYSELEK